MHKPQLLSTLAVALMIIAAIVALLGYRPASALGEPVFTEFQATLLQSNENPPVPFSGAYGSAELVLEEPSGELSYTVRVSGIPEATLAHIHAGAVGVNGPVVFDLLGDNQLDPSTVLTGTVSLTDAQIDALYSGMYYVNVHTAANPGGELRGQIYPREVTRVFSAPLRGENEVADPPVDSDGAGLAVIRLNDALTEFAYEVTVAGIPEATQAHIHEAPPGENGPVIFDLQGSATFDPDTPITGTFTITPTQVSTLFAGNYYVNVHTAAFSAGELRGQLAPDMPLLSATLSGDNEVPPVDTDASGVAIFDLDVSSKQLEFKVEVADIEDVTLAHIHEGAPDENGPVVFDLLAEGGGTLTPEAPLVGTLTLDELEILTLLGGDYYVNVHTTANPGGEIRGQIGAQQRFLTYRADLNGANERPDPVDTPATGTALVVLDTATNELTYRVTVADIENTITAAHFHVGAVDEAGPVVFDIFAAGFGPDSPLNGTIDLTDEQVDTLTSGNYYVNIHTDVHPAGEIRGQVYPVTAAGTYSTILLGSNEVPPVETDATGQATATLDSTQTKLSYTLSVANIENVTMAHIHRGPAGENGPVVYDLLAGGATLGNDDPISGTIDISPADVIDLMARNFYFNVHTSQNAAGEIRGQFGGVRDIDRTSLYLPIIGR